MAWENFAVFHSWCDRRGVPLFYRSGSSTTWVARRSAEIDDLIIAHRSPGVVLLWALACEMDDRGSTVTGDRVCRACSGRGTLLRWGRQRWPGYTEADPTGEPRAHAACESSLHGVWSFPYDLCACDGPTRPDTVSLAWLVAHLAAQRSPIVNDWPDQWRVNRDQEDATGDDSWQAQWWRAFEIWVTAGIAPDADDLAELLRALTPERKFAYINWDREPERPWYDLGDGRVYVDSISVDRGDPSTFSRARLTTIVMSGIPDQAAADIRRRTMAHDILSLEVSGVPRALTGVVFETISSVRDPSTGNIMHTARCASFPVTTFA